MSSFRRWCLAVLIFLVVLTAEIAIAIQFLPDVSNKQFDDFMLLSMGLAFFPFFVLLIAAAAVVCIFIAIAAAVASSVLPRRKVTIGEIAARKDWENQRRMRGGR
jgi:hypothetical protein